MTLFHFRIFGAVFDNRGQLAYHWQLAKCSQFELVQRF